MAKNMSPATYGTWGVVLLFQEYLTYSNLGVHYALNNYLALERDDLIRRRYLNSSLFISTIVSAILVVSALVIYFYSFSLYPGYELRDYYLPLAMIGSLVCYRQIFLTLFRQIGRLDLINLVEMIMAVLLLVTVFTGKEIVLIRNMLYAIIAGHVIAILIFLKAKQVHTTIWLFSPEYKKLLALGVPLLLANFIFYAMLLAVRTIMGGIYSKEEMGLFTFSTNISAACFLGINSLLWALFPRLLNKTEKDVPANEVLTSVIKINDMAIGASVLLLIIFVGLEPFLFKILPAYRSAGALLNGTLLCQFVLMLIVGESSRLTALEKRKSLIMASVAGLVTVLSLAILFVQLRLPYYCLLYSLLAGYFVYVGVIKREYRKTFDRGIGSNALFVKYESLPLIGMIVVLLELSLFESPLYRLGFILILIGHRKEIASLFSTFKSQLKYGKYCSVLK